MEKNPELMRSRETSFEDQKESKGINNGRLWRGDVSSWFMSAGFAPKQVRSSKARGDGHMGFGSGGFGEDTKHEEEDQHRL